MRNFTATLANVFASRVRVIALAGLATVALGFFLGRPGIAHAAGPDTETVFIFNTLAFLLWGRAGHVDGGGLHDARIRLGAHEECFK